MILQKISSFLEFNFPEKTIIYKYTLDDFFATFTQINAFFKETSVCISGDTELYITFSCAVVEDESPIDIMQKAKATMQELIKLKIPSQFKKYDENSTSSDNLKDENKWFHKIREAMENDKIIPFFQPIIDNKTGEINKYECLARIQDEAEILSPINFLESIKNYGLMNNLTKIMISKCFKVFAETDISFSINLTNADLLDERFFDFVVSKQESNKINPASVMFEFLEDVILDETHKTPLENLKKLKEHGFFLSLDNFGANRANLNKYIFLTGIKYIKLDGKLIKDIDKNSKNRSFVESIVYLSKKLDIKLIAEFVSTKEEQDTVKKLGIDYSQGYFFFKPQEKIKY